MRRVRQHPCNRYGTLYLQPDHYQAAFDELIRLRDQQLSVDHAFSGEPTAFQSWAEQQLRKLASDAWYSKQLSDQAAALKQQSAGILRDLERIAAELTAKVDALEAERQHLLSFLADE